MARRLRKAWWREAANVIGALGLFLALAGTTWGVWEGVAQSRSARFYSQLGVLTQLSSEARASDRAVAAGRIQELRCRRQYERSYLGPRDERALDESLDVYDVMAWLFNHDLGFASARRLWGPRIADIRAAGIKLLSRSEIEREWPELAAFSTQGVTPVPSLCAKSG